MPDGTKIPNLDAVRGEIAAAGPDAVRQALISATVDALALAPGLNDGDAKLVGGRTYFWSSTSTETADNYIVRTAAGTATGRWIITDREWGYNVKWFGAKCDGVTDDSDALQRALDYVVPRSQLLYLPGNILISRQMEVGRDQTNVGWRINGSSRESCTIYQATMDTNIFRLSGQYMHSFEIAHLRFQSVAGSSCIAVVHDGPPSGSHFNFALHHITLGNGMKRGFRGPESKDFAIWGIRANDIVSSVRGATFYYQPVPATGQPMITLKHIYIGYFGIVEETQIQFNSGDTVSLTDIEFNGGFYNSGGNNARQIQIESCFPVLVENCKSEQASVALGSNGNFALWFFPNALVALKNVSCGGWHATGTGTVVFAQATSGGRMTVDNGNMTAADTSDAGTSGVFGFSDQWEYAYNMRLDPSVGLTYSYMAGPLLRGDRLQYKTTKTVGDTDTVLTTADPNNVYYNTALTTNRTCSLPSTGVWPGMEFTVTRRGGGSFTLLVQDTLSAKSVYLAKNQSVTFRALSSGEWLPITQLHSPQPTGTDVRGDANVILSAADSVTQYYPSSVTFTANRTITLPSAGVVDGMRVTVINRAAGAFALTVSDPLSGKNTALTQFQSVTYVANAGGEWVPFSLPAASYTPPQPMTVQSNGDSAVTLTAASPMHQYFDTPLTTNRTIALPTTGLFNGMQFTITRSRNCVDLFTLNVQDGLSGKNTLLYPNQTVTYIARSTGEWTILRKPSPTIQSGYIGAGDANYVITATEPRDHFSNGTLTANRTVTLPSTGLYAGLEFMHVNLSVGGFTQTVVDPLFARNTVLAFGQAVTYRSVTGNEWVPVAAASQPLSATVTLDFPSIAAGGQAELNVTLPGAVVGSVVMLGLPASLEAGLVISPARISAANTVTVRVSNITAAAIDPAAAQYTVRTAL
jgi:hypothetical protein